MLSELQIMNNWASVLTGYRSTGERIFEFARAIEAEARRDALEEAAKVVVETKEWKNGKWTSTICPTTADAIAAAIRKLKETTQ